MSEIYVDRPLICIFPTLFLKLHVLLELFSFKSGKGDTFNTKLSENRGLLSWKLLNQGFFLAKLKSSLRTFYDRHHVLVDRYGIAVTTDMFHLS